MMLRALAGNTAVRGGDVQITGLTSDSRQVGAGDMFAALPGTQYDGRDFIAKALENGAAAILSPPGLPELPVPVIVSENPRRVYAEFAAKLWPGQPDTMIAVTGTNGKSSTIEFLRQIWVSAGFNAACFGTLGVVTEAGLEPLSHTTPDAVALHKTLKSLADKGVTHAGMEASSHGLDQYRLDGVKLSAIAFTNLTQDHFDYHTTMENYFQAKARLFTDFLPKGAPAIINVDTQWGRRLTEMAKAAGLEVMTIGRADADIRIAKVRPLAAAQMVTLDWAGHILDFELPLAGEFQVQNAVTALALSVLTGVDKPQALQALGRLCGVAGRMQKAGETKDGAPVFIDFAHTPDGLEKLLQGVRPHTKGKIVIVFGCGGDRDPDKRAKMGKIADKFADKVIVTDDNPRTENPASIRAQVMQGCPGACEIGDRREAIAQGIAQLAEGDCLVIAGKGHESGQIVGDKILPFSDVEVAREILS